MNIQGTGTNFYQNPSMQANQLRQMIENSGSETLKKMAKEGASDQQLQQYILQNPGELEGGKEGTPWADGAIGTGTANGLTGQTTSTADQVGNASAAGSAAVDNAQMSEESSGDCYDEDDEIPTDEAMATSGMCGMDDVSNADRCKPHTQQCLGETKAIKKVLETIQKADQDNPTIGGDIKEVDGLIDNLSQKLKKGKKAADGAFSNPEDASACQKEVDDIVKKAVDIAGNNGVEIEVSEKRGGELGVGGPQGAGGAEQGGGAKQAAAPQAAKGADKAQGAGQAQQAQQAEQSNKQNEAKNATKANDKANETGGGGGGEDQQKPFKIVSEPKEVDKDLSLSDVKDNPQLAAALEASLDETIAQLDAKEQEGAEQQPLQSIDLGATQKDSPIDKGLQSAGKPQENSGSVFGSQQAAAAPHAQQTTTAAPSPAGKGGGMQAAGPVGAAGGAKKSVDTSGIEAKMKRAGIDSGKTFKVKAQVYEPGMDVKIQRDGDASPVKVGKDMGDASMKVKPPPLAAIDQNGEIHRIGDIRATDGGKSGAFSAKIKEGQPIMNLPAAVNTVQGDVALPGTKTEDANNAAKEAKEVKAQ